MEPTILIAPVQNKSEELRKPFAKSPFEADEPPSLSILSPRLKTLSSILKANPIKPPKIILNKFAIALGASKAIPSPSTKVVTPAAVITISLKDEDIFFFNKRPKRPPKITVNALMNVAIIGAIIVLGEVLFYYENRNSCSRIVKKNG